MNINPVKLGGAAVYGGATLVAAGVGFAVAGSMTRNAYTKDLTSERTRFVGTDGTSTFEGPSPKLGEWLMMGSLVFGGLVAAVGGGWRGHALQQARISGKAMDIVTKLGSGALLGVGIGMVSGGISASMAYKDVSSRRAIPGDKEAAEVGGPLSGLLPTPPRIGGDEAPATTASNGTPPAAGVSPEVQALLDRFSNLPSRVPAAPAPAPAPAPVVGGPAPAPGPVYLPPPPPPVSLVPDWATAVTTG